MLNSKNEYYVLIAYKNCFHNATVLIYYEEVNGWEIGYNLGQKYWGLGYTTEAMKKVIDFAKNELKCSEIIGRYAKENYASGNVMKKRGFKFEKYISYECNDSKNKLEGIQCRLNII